MRKRDLTDLKSYCFIFNCSVIILLQEIYKDRKKFSKEVFEVASSDLVNMGITVVSYTLKDIRDEEVSLQFPIINVLLTIRLYKLL